MEIFAPYAHAIAALALWGLMVTVLGMLSTVGRTAEGRTESGLPKRNYADPVYRRVRAQMNAVESSPAFIAATVAAIMAGAAPFWVNVFASLFLVLRLGMAVVHIRTENQPARSAFFAGAMLFNLALVVMAVGAAVF